MYCFLLESNHGVATKCPVLCFKENKLIFFIAFVPEINADVYHACYQFICIVISNFISNPVIINHKSVPHFIVLEAMEVSRFSYTYYIIIYYNLFLNYKKFLNI